MKKTFLVLALLVVGAQAAHGQFNLVKKFERAGVNARTLGFSSHFPPAEFDRFDADGDGTRDLVFVRPEATYPLGTMRIVFDPRDSTQTVGLPLQGNQGLGFQDPQTPLIGFLDIWPGTGKQDGIRSFAFGGEGLYLYDDDVVTADGRLRQTFTMSREIYRLVGLLDYDGDALVDFVMLNQATRTLEVWGSDASE